MASTVNFRRTQRFREQKHRQNDQSGPQRFLHYFAEITLKYFKVQTHVQTTREFLDLNMDFVHLTHGLKQLYEYVSMQELWFKTRPQHGISEPVLYVDLVYKFK